MVRGPTGKFRPLPSRTGVSSPRADSWSAETGSSLASQATPRERIGELSAASRCQSDDYDELDRNGTGYPSTFSHSFPQRLVYITCIMRISRRTDQLGTASCWRCRVCLMAGVPPLATRGSVAAPVHFFDGWARGAAQKVFWVAGELCGRSASRAISRLRSRLRQFRYSSMRGCCLRRAGT